MKDSLIVVNHIGTSVVEVIEEELNTLINEIERSTGSQVVLAFSSQRAIDKLERKNVKIEHIHDAILRAAGVYKTIKVLPVHLVGGGDYERVKAFVENAEKTLFVGGVQTKILLIEALLADSNLVDALAEVLYQRVDQKDTYVLFVGHGSIHASSSYYEGFLKAFKRFHPNAGYVSIDQSFEDIHSQNVLVLPLFTVTGHHVKKDLFESEASVYKKLLKQGKKVHLIKKGLLVDEAIRALYVRRITHGI